MHLRRAKHHISLLGTYVESIITGNLQPPNNMKVPGQDVTSLGSIIYQIWSPLTTTGGGVVGGLVTPPVPIPLSPITTSPLPSIPVPVPSHGAVAVGGANTTGGMMGNYTDLDLNSVTLPGTARGACTDKVNYWTLNCKLMEAVKVEVDH